MERPVLIAMRPSGLSKVIGCAASRRREARMPESTSSWAQEGSAAHAVGEYCLREGLSPFEMLGAKIEVEGDTPGSKKVFIVDGDMARAVSHYVKAVRDVAREVAARYRAAGGEYEGPLLEQKIYVPPIHNKGTVDCAIIDKTEKALHLIDYKHGAGVFVSEVWNAQFLAYACGLLNLYYKYTPLAEVTVHLVVVQPRFPGTEPVRSQTLTGTEVERWVQETLEPAIIASEAPEAKAHAGDHCRFCAAKGACLEYLQADKKPYGHVPIRPQPVKHEALTWLR